MIVKVEFSDFNQIFIGFIERLLIYVNRSQAFNCADVQLDFILFLDFEYIVIAFLTILNGFN